MWTVARHIDAPADAVWRILTDLEAWPEWGPTVAGAELDGAAFELGATGRVWTPVGVPLPFTITDIEPGRSWAWRVAGVPATHHGVEPSGVEPSGVEPRGAGCRAWMSAPVWAPAYLPVLAVALRRIERMAVRG